MTTINAPTTNELPRGGSGDMFDRIARRYDMLNRVLSMGIDRGWRKQAVATLKLKENSRVLDLATGTADVALEVLRQEPLARVVGVDPSAGMLEIGQRKIEEAGCDESIDLQLGDGEQLAFADDTFDGITIAFGIRNVPDRAKALSEMARVTRPGGRVAILELSEPRGGLLGPLARFHVHHLVPRLGGLLSGSREYRYLQQSIAAFPPPEEFADLMTTSGLEVLEIRPLTFGVCCLYVGTPKEDSE